MIHERKEKKQRKKRFIRLLLIILLAIVGTNFFLSKHKTEPPQQKIKLLEAQIKKETPSSTQEVDRQNSPGLEEAIKKALEGTNGTYGIIVKNLETHESYFLNEKQAFNSASLYKLWVMATVFQEVQNHKLSLTDTISKDVILLNREFNLTPDPNEQTTGKLTLSVQDALYNMITISNNNAALLLTDKLSVPTIESFLQKNGFTQSMIGIEGKPPTTTAYDISVFFEKLYNGDFVNKQYTDTMISLLKQQKLNDKLPKYLPDGIIAAHKTGELDNFTHDAGIVYTPNGNYILVMLSQSDAPDLANERIADVSQAVYTYFSKQNNKTNQ